MGAHFVDVESGQARAVRGTGMAKKDSTCAVIVAVFALLSIAFVGAFFLRSYVSDPDSCRPGVIAKPPGDRRRMRYMELPNGLKAVVISDPEADLAAASIDVHVGSLSDPEDKAGLAHFLEHMLFTGNAKYPAEGEYFDFVSGHGGAANAATGTEHTTFHFTIPPQHLLPALDRLMQFFVSPLFVPDMIEREKHAVSSEHAKNIGKDDWRFQRLQRLTNGNPDCPLVKFMTGDMSTLANVSRDDLLAFHSEHYTPNRMGLVVLGREPLDDLEDVVRRLATDIPEGFSRPPDFGEALRPGPRNNSDLPAYGNDEGRLVGGHQIDYVPIADVESLRMIWYMDSLAEYYDQKSLEYLTKLLGDEGRGSLVSYLRLEKGWVDMLSASAASQGTFFAELEVSMVLTDAGAVHVDEVVEEVFRFVGLLTSTPPERWRWEEDAELAAISWRFLTQGDPGSTCQGLSGALNSRLPPCDLLRAPFAYRTFDPGQIAAAAARLRPDTVLVYRGSRSFEAHANSRRDDWITEEYYGLQYRVSPVSPARAERWIAALDLPADDLRLPPPNRFIPTHFDLVRPRALSAAEDRQAPTPALLIANESMRLWHHVDTAFGEPKAVIQCSVLSPTITSQDRVWTSQLLLHLVSDTLQQEAYPAAVAGLTAHVKIGVEGLKIGVDGYSGKLPAMVELAARAVSPSTNLSATRFDAVQQLVVRGYDAERFAGALSAAVRALKMVTRRYTAVYDKLNAVPVVRALTFDDVVRQQQELFTGGAFVECLVNGNINASGAEEAMATMRSAMGHRPPLSTTERAALEQRVLSVPQGFHAYAVPSPDPAERNSAAVLYYDLGSPGEDLKRGATAELLSLLIQQPCFAQMRTKEQLGYVVGVEVFGAWQAVAMVLYAMSDWVGADYLDARFEAFLDAQAVELAKTSVETFETARRALEANLAVRDLDLGGQSSRIWGEVEMHSCRFARAREMQTAVRGVVLDDVVSLFQTAMHNATSRRKLSIWVRAPGDERRPRPRGNRAGPKPKFITEAGLERWRALRPYVRTNSSRCQGPLA